MAVLSLNYNIRYDGLYDDNGGKLLLALLPYTAGPGEETRGKDRPGKAITQT